VDVAISRQLLADGELMTGRCVLNLRFQDGRDELLERLTAIEEKLEGLPTIDTIDELRRDLKKLPYQLECIRRLQQIEGDLRELRTNAATARFAKEGEAGYIPEQSLGEERRFSVPLDESVVRSSTIQHFSYIEERLDKFDLSVYQSDGPDPHFSLDDLSVDLELLQRTVREEARRSVKWSLNEIDRSGLFLTDQLHEVLEQIDLRYKEIGRVKEIEDKRSEGAQ
jgi:hypothetical protein